MHSGRFHFEPTGGYDEFGDGTGWKRSSSSRVGSEMVSTGLNSAGNTVRRIGLRIVSIALYSGVSHPY